MTSRQPYLCYQPNSDNNHDNRERESEPSRNIELSVLSAIQTDQSVTDCYQQQNEHRPYKVQLVAVV